MKIGPIALGVVALSGCLRRPPRPPEPLTLQSPLAIADVVPRAVSVLLSAGLQVTTADVRTGEIDGTRTATPQEQQGAVQCSFSAGSIAYREGLTTLAIRVSATPADSGSNVTISARTTTDLSRLPGALTPADSSGVACMSSGLVERRVAEALRH
ncbi:MAG TPA: hypothetical protein VJU87_12620 [Gemmatimonadaceae bacterium]|nr:hypothetical protein [Gemmatimonadaceae bacterium]